MLDYAYFFETSNANEGLAYLVMAHIVSSTAHPYDKTGGGRMECPPMQRGQPIFIDSGWPFPSCFAHGNRIENVGKIRSLSSLQSTM